MEPGIGHVVVVRTGGVFAWLIRLGAWLRGKPHGDDHVAIVVGDNGELVEARPDGVQLGQLSQYPPRWTVTNQHQPLTPEQGHQVAQVARSLLHHGYDWAAISADAANVFDLTDPMVSPWTSDTAPARFVCSSLAAWVYTRVGLPAPAGGRFTTPADWVWFIYTNHYE